MLVEFTIISFTPDPHLNELIADALKLMDDSGLSYELTESMTCIEGEWDEIMPVIRKCHNLVRAVSPHIVTVIKIEDEVGANNMMPADYVPSVGGWAYA